MAPSDSAIRRRAERKPNSKLAAILQGLDSQAEEGPSRLQGGPDPENTGSTASSAQGIDGYLVRWRQGATEGERRRQEQRGGYRVRESFQSHAWSRKPEDDDTYEVIELKPGTSRAQLARQLARSGGVIELVPNYVYTAQLDANDPYVMSRQAWGSMSAPGIGATTFWSDPAEWAQYQRGPQAYIGVIDDGAFTQHTDLLGQFSNPGERLDGIDNDGNGKIDDIHGWNFISNNANIFGGSNESHGTHVSGIAAAIGGNGEGISGVAPLTNLIGAKFLSPNGGTSAHAIQAFQYFAELKRSGVNVVAVNCSWGGYNFDSAMYTAIQELGSLGVLVICAAGNDRTTRPMYPAGFNLDNIIAVGSIDSNGSMSRFSNRSRSWVDIFAPGGSIVSTVPGAGNSSSYAIYSGTSMATPSISGMVGVLSTMFPGKTAQELKNAILGSAIPTASLQRWATSGGYANLPGAIALLGGATAPPSPSQPTPLSAIFNPANIANETNNNAISATITGTAGASVGYSVVGISAADLSSGSLNGTVLLDTNGTATINWTIAADQITEGTESFGIRLNGSTTNAATINIEDSSIAPPANQNPAPTPTPTPSPALDSELWGTTRSDRLIAAATQTKIAGVSQFGLDNGRATIDIVTGGGAPTTYVLGDSQRGIYYNDGNARSAGTIDYLRVTNLQAGDTLQLLNGSYLYSSNRFSGTVSLYHDSNGDGRISTRGASTDELIAIFDRAASLFQSGLIGVTWVA